MIVSLEMRQGVFVSVSTHWQRFLFEGRVFRINEGSKSITVIGRA